MMHYIMGDATDPVRTGNDILVHCCNNRGGWGSGFTRALSARWKEPERAYRSLSSFILGSCDVVEVGTNLWVANLIGQDGYGRSDSPGYPFIRYDALKEGLMKVRTHALCHSPIASIHMPRMGCGLAGGTWERVRSIIIDCLSDIDIYVYDIH